MVYPENALKVKRVVVVDDDQMIANMIADFLELLNVDVVGVFYNATECIQKITDGLEAEVVISDYDMGKVNGIELFEALELINSKITKILVTGNHYIARIATDRWPTILKGSPDYFEKLSDLVSEKA
jgi:DNA-binding NtrC family response regulator